MGISNFQWLDPRLVLWPLFAHMREPIQLIIGWMIFAMRFSCVTKLNLWEWEKSNLVNFFRVVTSMKRILDLFFKGKILSKHVWNNKADYSAIGAEPIQLLIRLQKFDKLWLKIKIISKVKVKSLLWLNVTKCP